jgi:hypothetical protein
LIRTAKLNDLDPEALSFLHPVVGEFRKRPSF